MIFDRQKRINKNRTNLSRDQIFPNCINFSRAYNCTFTVTFEIKKKSNSNQCDDFNNGNLNYCTVEVAELAVQVSGYFSERVRKWAISLFTSMAAHSCLDDIDDEIVHLELSSNCGKASTNNSLLHHNDEDTRRLRMCSLHVIMKLIYRRSEILKPHDWKGHNKVNGEQSGWRAFVKLLFWLRDVPWGQRYDDSIGWEGKNRVSEWYCLPQMSSYDRVCDRWSPNIG